LDDFLPALPPYISLVPFRVEHASLIKARDRTAAVLPISTEAILQMQAMAGHAITALLHGQPAACFGSVHIWTGVEEMWCLLENRSRKYALSLTKIAIAYSDFRVISENLHRLQITVRSDDLRAVRWGKAIGFETDGLMKKYGPDGSDFFLMSRT
jgi:hypothetical protein